MTDGGAMIVWKSLAVDGVGHSLLLLLLHLLPCLSLCHCVMSGGFDCWTGIWEVVKQPVWCNDCPVGTVVCVEGLQEQVEVVFVCG